MSVYSFSTYIDGSSQLLVGVVAFYHGLGCLRCQTAKSASFGIVELGQILSFAEIANFHNPILKKNVSWFNIVVNDSLQLTVANC